MRLILICNVGSTSLKFKLFADETVLVTAKIERIGEAGKGASQFRNTMTGFSTEKSGLDIPDYAKGISLFLVDLTGQNGPISSVNDIEVVGFKTVIALGYPGVHDLTPDVQEQMRLRLDISPLHNACYLEAIRTFEKILPGKRLIGVFETDFHRTVPLHAKLYGTPYSWYEKDGVQRLGYHGASHGYIAHRMEKLIGREGKIISCHLGGSSSVCAIRDGKSVEISSGFSPQSGLSHATRVGDLDVYALFYQLSLGKTLEHIADELGGASGLLGISGVSGDMREIEIAASNGNPRAQLALNVFSHEIVRYIGSYHAVLGGLDCLVFTGGIGENSAFIRERVCTALHHLGIRFDPDRNQSGAKERLLTVETSPVQVWVVPTDEELQVAGRIREHLGARA